MVCVTNKSEVELHMLDRELLSAFCVFLENLPRKEELSALPGWHMVYSIFLLWKVVFGDLECSMKFGEVQRCSVIN